MAPPEAIVTLTPLLAPIDFRRTFKLSPSKANVVVGRASKNADKGLVPAVQNAWFDSPIMSRKHASFSLSSDGQETVYLQDFKSTHGTFVSGRRLLQFENVRLKEWDVITFGIRITAGAETYPPRSFTFNVKWQARSDPLYPTLTSVTRSFEVPDNDDSFSDVSREDSLAILDSHPRTFSVPSSDDEVDDECVTIETQQPSEKIMNKDSQIAMNRPSLSKVREKDQEAAKLVTSEDRLKSLGASQDDPIDLDKGHKHAIDLDSDEDDGPEVLPIIGSSKAPTQDLWSTASQRADSIASQYADDEDIFRDLESVEVRNTQTPNHNSYTSGPHVSFDLPSPDSMQGAHDPFETQHSSHNVSMSRTEEDEGFNSTQRPSSPSDAALAKKSFALVDPTNGTEAKPLMPQVMRNAFDQEMTRLNFPSEQEIRPQNQGQGEKLNRVENISWIEPYQSHSSSTDRLYPPPNRRNAEVSYGYSENLGIRNGTSKPYSTGPFSMSDSNPESSWMAPKYNNHPSRDDLYSYPNSYTSGYYPATWDDSFFYKGASGTRPRDIASTLGPYLVQPPPPPPPPPPPKIPLSEQLQSPYENPQRVPISNLVHPDASNRGLKRKADVMEKEDSMLLPKAAASSLTQDQDSMILPDAQPRAQLILPDTSLSQETPVVQDTSHSAMNKASAALSVASQAPLPKPDGPARKKAKTSPSKAAGIGKFVSGIAVGVVGVLATFIATIPASVREEALRELNNAA